MRITVIGSGTVALAPDRRQSCVLVETEEENIVFDLGSGALRGIVESGFDPFGIDRLFFTHFHLDHITDLPALMFSTNFGAPEPRSRTLHVSGPEPFGDLWDSLRGVWGSWMDSRGYTTEVSTLPLDPAAPLALPGLNLSWARAEHRPESVAYRLDAPSGSLVYTGDTEYCEAVVNLTRGADTLLTECSFPDDAPVKGHLTPSGVARMASEAGVRRVVLTHLFPQVLELDLVSEVGRGFDGEVVVAQDGLSFEV